MKKYIKKCGKNCFKNPAYNKRTGATGLRKGEPSQSRLRLEAGEVAHITEHHEAKVEGASGEAVEAADAVKYVDGMLGAEAEASAVEEDV
jgi:hypothetical protein